ncbi:hypothetical protein V6N13_035547 [Hibiscus sabdariffa]
MKSRDNARLKERTNGDTVNLNSCTVENKVTEPDECEGSSKELSNSKSKAKAMSIVDPESILEPRTLNAADIDISKSLELRDLASPLVFSHQKTLPYPIGNINKCLAKNGILEQGELSSPPVYPMIEATLCDNMQAVKNRDQRRIPQKEMKKGETATEIRKKGG